MAQVVEAAGLIVARSIVAQAKASFMGMESGAKRQEAAIAGDIAEGVLNTQLPLAGALLQSFPSLRKTLRRNPQLLDLALSKLGGLGAGAGGGQSPPSGNGTGTPRFHL